MADGAPAGTSSTPTPAAEAAPASAAAPTPAAVATPASTPEAAPTPTPAPTGSAPAKDGAATSVTEVTNTDGTKAAAPEVPAFELPQDLKLDPKAVEKFSSALKGLKPVDGKVSLTPQDLVNLYADQARDAYARWQQGLVAQNAAWEAESKARFSASQLAAAETGVGFITSFDPAFREFCKNFRNHPTLVNAMRIVGERLSEDTFERASAPPTPAKRPAKDVMYPKRN